MCEIEQNEIKKYLLLYSKELGNHQKVRNCLKNISEIIDIKHEFENTFYLSSKANSKLLANIIYSKIGGNNKFIIIEITDNKHGWLSQSSWNFFNS